MSQQGDDWEVRIDPLSLKAVALRYVWPAALVVCAILVGNLGLISAAFGIGAMALLAEFSMLQIVVTPTRLQIRSWLDRLHRDPGVVRCIGPGWALVIGTSGVVRLLGPDPMIVPLPSGGVMVWWYRKRLADALRRAGVEVIDKPQMWMGAHSRRRLARRWARRVGFVLTLAALASWLISARASDQADWIGIGLVLILLAAAILFVGELAGPPDPRDRPGANPRSESTTPVG